jgi:cation transport regulator ChaC
VEQPTTQAEVFAMNTSAQNTQPLHQHQETENQEDQQHDSEEEIEAIIEDELACLRPKNERLRHMQEHLDKRKVMAKRSQIMQ